MQTISWNEVWPCHSDELHELRFLITLQKQPNTDQNHSRTISPADFPRSRLRFPAFLASDVAHPEGCSQGDTSAVSESLKAPPNRFSPQRLDGFTLEMLHLLRRNSQRTLNASAALRTLPLKLKYKHCFLPLTKTSCIHRDDRAGGGDVGTLEVSPSITF